MLHIGRRLSLTAVAIAITTLAGCAGRGIPPLSTQSGAASVSRVQPPAGRPHVFARGVTPNATCPKGYLACKVFRNSTGLVVYWCFEHATSCDATNQYTWSGGVCKRKAQPCTEPAGPFVKNIRAKWSGPFQCDPSISVCGGGTSGTYMVDLLTAAKNEPKPSPGYAYKADIHGAGGSTVFDFYIGLQVEP